MEDFWKKTAELFEKLIDKPKMGEKLLKKPPPKFIYDIIMNTMKVTNFPKGLFTNEEIDPKFFDSDPRNKIDILQKVIDITKIVTNENFDIKTTNILKGEEPDKTNHFLQLFHKAATNGKDNSKFITKYLDHKKKKAEDKKQKEEEAKKAAEPKHDVKKEPPQPAAAVRKEEPKAESKQMIQAEEKGDKSKPKGLISDKKDKEDATFSNDAPGNDKGGIKMTAGTGMKMDQKIFAHPDTLTANGKKDQKPQVSNVDLETIKSLVQDITKNANPIGKIIEFIGDDIDLMNKELQNWIKESKSYKERYDEEIKKSEDTLAPLQNELLELEESIKDEQMQIKSIKSRLIKNETIIQNLITNVISFKNEEQ